MGTSESSARATLNREARSALYGGIAMIAVGLVSIYGLLSPVFSGQPISSASVIEVIVIAGQIATVIFAMLEISRGRTEIGALRLIFSFSVANIIRTLLHASMGLPLGIITALMISAIGFLTLPRGRASSVTIHGYGVGGAIVLIDLYASNFFIREAAPIGLVQASQILAIVIFLAEVIILVTLSRTVSFAPKIANYFALFTLSAVMLVGFAGIQALSNQIATGSDVTGFARLTLKILERWTIITGVAVSFLGAVAGVVIARMLTNPLNRLAKTTGLIASGDLEARALVRTDDEVGELAGAFNGMADSLKGLVGQLEMRVQNRTKDLQRRAAELQAAVEIGRVVTSMRDLEHLLQRSTQLITERFGFYHAGIFLVDEAQEYAVLQAASSEGGLKMLEASHRLKVGETGIVGFVAQSGRARIALDVGQDAVFFDNPHLPQTRSEMGLPLVAGGVVLGVLDVQSTESQAFDEQDISTLQILADQLAIAIENARLLNEVQNALEAARVAYGEISREAWAKIIRSQPRLSYVAAQSGNVQQNNNPPSMDVVRTLESGDIVISDDGHTLGIPVKVRGQSIAALRLQKQDTSNAWTEEEIALATALSEQLSGALESARLYKESQQRAARETLVSDISARITALPRVDTILRETVQELGQAIGNAAISFQLLERPNERGHTYRPGNGSGTSSETSPSRKDEE